LEISSISTYILAGFRRRSAAGVESSLKYFLLGSFATAFFLYGVAMTFGATGTTSVYPIANSLRGGAPALAYVAMALMFVGLGFKVASAPFHVWRPDVYEGAPAPVVALMSTAPKAAAFAVLLRILFAAAAPGWFWLIWISAALSMTLGNIGALVQTNVKRLLAYSSIAHAGYLLVAFAAAKEVGISAAIFYAASYAVMNAGAFLVISHFANVGERYVTVDDYAGLGRRAPCLSAFADRYPHYRRVFCEILRLQRGAAIRACSFDHHRRGEQRHRRLLLPARDRVHVHARAARGRSSPAHARDRGRLTRPQRGRHHIPGRAPRPRASIRAPVRPRTHALKIHR